MGRDVARRESAAKRTATDAIAGAAAGAFARTAVAPIDRVKLIIQLRPTIQPPPSASVSQHRTAWQIFRAIVREEGALSLFRGNGPTVLIEAGSSALNFLSFDWYKSASHSILTSMEHQHPSLRENNNGTGSRKRRMLRSFVSGGLAGATTITLLYPLAFMRTRLAVDMGNTQKGERKFANGMSDVMKQIWRSDGWRGFYKGYGIALISVSMHRFVYLGGYDFIKSEYAATAERANAKMQMAERFAAAQFVSMAASTLHYPLDCVRRRLMMEAGRTEGERRYRNTIHCFRKVWIEEGSRGFFLGLGPNLVRCIGSALVLVSYDEFKRILTGE
uniref:ADP/ATP translocase n=1 Tax=Minutocellus polymorphus TaxID=265543 RepID=A0A7S0AD04_9STRA